MTIKSGSQEYPLGMALTHVWQDFSGIQSDTAVPLNQIACPFCNFGEKLDPNVFNPNRSVGIIPNADWEQHFTLLNQQSYVPTNGAFAWSDDFPPQKYGVITLKCSNCENAFFVHYLLRHSELKEGLRTPRFWNRLIIPNTDFTRFENRIWELDRDRVTANKEFEGKDLQLKIWKYTSVILAIIMFFLLII
ncbi:hypothetical protein [Deinococcus arenicola]|uniref:Uncharacterized protein n=1 Tax=Deinococcus arenicola TaxID=2994950 RepID=A0ABU4DRL6_9DEIO|nr:hypothetical protein [Deinococcus sp. ZS9-10]MDV6375069.1 hypothetical protein [Deinococcus sp. ZS9-10]